MTKESRKRYEKVIKQRWIDASNRYSEQKIKEEKEKKYTGYGYHGGGRKAKGEEPKTTTMSIVCTASERAFIKEQAKNCGLSISGFILAAINYFYERELKH
jgi:hypothetical protein